MSRLVTALLWLSLAGCQPYARVRATVTVPHPSATPLVEAATQIARPDPEAEQAYGFASGSLVDRAALRTAEPGRVCVQVSHWAHPLDPGRAALGDYRFRLASVRDSAEVVVEETSRAFVGRWTVQRNGRPGWSTGYRVPRVGVQHQATDVCFEGADLLDAQTTELRLETARGEQHWSFVWRLDPDARYSAGAASAGPIHPGPHDPMAGGGGGYGVGAPAGGLTALPYQGAPPVPGGHPPDIEALRAQLDGRFDQLRHCLARAAEREPALLQQTGDLIAQFTVGPSGIGNVSIVQNDFTPGAARCMTEHLQQLPVAPDPLRWTSLFRYGVRTQRRTQ